MSPIEFLMINNVYEQAMFIASNWIYGISTSSEGTSEYVNAIRDIDGKRICVCFGRGVQTLGGNRIYPTAAQLIFSQMCLWLHRCKSSLNSSKLTKTGGRWFHYSSVFCNSIAFNSKWRTLGWAKQEHYLLISSDDEIT